MQDKDKERKYFNSFTSDEPWNAFDNKTYKKIVKLFLKCANPKENDLIIDMGCGTGELTNEIRNASFKNVKGYDISKNCIKIAKKQFPAIDFQVVDIEKTNLKDNSVDILFFCGILHHFTNMEKVINESRRILKKGGKIFLFEPNATNPVLWLFRDENSPIKSKKLKTPNEKFLEKRQIEGMFKKHNFKINRIECVSGIKYTKDHFKKLFPFPLYYSVYTYNLFDTILNLTFLRKKFGSFILGYIEKP